jgi:sphinganine-1-phosphate aldolase
VTSISCDTHKYGFAPKGSSVIMWCSKEWRFHQYYVCADWTGGIYATPTIAGSRPGANLAATWAVMVHMGRSGYTKAASTVFKAADVVEAGVKSIPELEQFGTTDHAVVAFGAKRDGSSGVDIYKVVNAMAKRGWSLNSLQRPACVHLCITYANAGMADEFVEDLASCVEEVKANPDAYKGGQAAMYGSSTAMAPQGMLNQVAGMYMDTVYRAD